MLTAEQARELFCYDPSTGDLTWRVAMGPRAVIGAVAGTSNANGRKYVKTGGKRYLVHRVAYLMVTGVWPSKLLDHEDLNGANNRWDNLRDATPRQNQANRRATRTNKSGFKGVSWSKRSKKYRAQIRVNGTVVHLLYTPDKEEAAVWYKAFSELAHGEFARSD